MIEFPAWAEEALQRRFNDLEKSIPKHDRVQHEREQEKLLFLGLKNAMDEKQRHLMMRWEEKEAYCTGVEKELIYRHGLTDGVRLMILLLQTDAL